MNIHPIFVHFPVALLSLYAISECVPIRLGVKIKGFNSIKLAFLFLGVLGSIIAGVTGLMAADDITGPVAHLVHAHKTFAIITIVYFLIIGCVYLALLLKEKPAQLVPSKFNRIIHGLATEKVIYYFLKLRVIFALIGLVLVTITGGLGGMIVYGPTIDPFADFIYRTLFGG